MDRFGFLVDGPDRVWHFVDSIRNLKKDPGNLIDQLTMHDCSCFLIRVLHILFTAEI